MSKSFQIKVNEHFDFSVTDTEVADLDILSKGERDFHLLSQGKSFHIDTIETDFSNKSYAIRVNGNLYQVQIKDKLDQLIDKMGLTVGNKKKEAHIKSPMPGLILELVVSEGEEVKEGDDLLILEAMKMENVLTAPKDGIVKSIHAKQGESVEKGQLLIEMED
jgi:biotin carboxyl carrier protein